MRGEGRDPSFLLLAVSGGGSGLKPGIGLGVTEADIRDLTGLGYLRELPTTGTGTRMKFVVTSAGRAAGRERPTVVEVDSEGATRTARPAPSLDDVLAWLAALEDHSPSVFEGRGALVNQALADFDEGQLEAVCRRLIELAHADLIGFMDPGRNLSQLSPVERIGLATQFSVTVAGRDRLAREKALPGMTVNQIITATNAQVAGRDVINMTFGQFLDAAQQQLDQLTDLNDEDRAEAQGMLEKLRSATTQVAIGTVQGGAGAVLGAIFMGLLHMHP